MTSNDRDCKGKSSEYGGYCPFYRRPPRSELMQRIENHSVAAHLLAEKLLRNRHLTGIHGLTKCGIDVLQGMVPAMRPLTFKRALAFLIEVGFVEYDPTNGLFFVPLALAEMCPIDGRNNQPVYLHREAARVLEGSSLLHRVMPLLPQLKAAAKPKSEPKCESKSDPKSSPKAQRVNAQIARDVENSPQSSFWKGNSVPPLELVEVKEVREEIRAAACGAPSELKENLNLTTAIPPPPTPSSPPAAEDRTGLARRSTEPGVVVVKNDLLQKWVGELTANRPGTFPKLRAELSHPVLQREIAAGSLNLSQLVATAAQATLDAVAQKEVRDRDAYYLGVVTRTLTRHREACEKAPGIPVTALASQGGGHGTYPPLRVVPGGSQRVGFRHPEDVRFEESARRFLNGGVA